MTATTPQFSIDTPSSMPVPSFTFSTKEIPTDERFEAFGTYANHLTRVTPLPGTDPSSFTFEDRLFDLDTLLVGPRSCGPVHVNRGQPEMALNPTDAFRFVFVREGSTILKETITAGSLYVLDHAQPHQEWVQGMDSVALFVSREEILSVASIAEAFHGRAIPGPMAGLFGDYLVSLVGQFSALTRAELPAVVQTTCRMLEACLVPHQQGMDMEHSPLDMSRLARAKRYIRFRLLVSNVSVEQVLQHVGMSRRQLYRLFEPEGGVATYIRKQRLRRAHAILSDPDSTLLVYQVADLCGFSSDAEFSRKFRKAFGYPPGEVASMSRTGSVRPRMQKNATVTGLGDWLQRHR